MPTMTETCIAQQLQSLTTKYTMVCSGYAIEDIASRKVRPVLPYKNIKIWMMSSVVLIIKGIEALTTP